MNEFENDRDVYSAIRFEGLDSSQRKIHGKEFDECTFYECNFSDTEFDQCKFVDCHFLKCNLSVVKIARCKFLDVVFEQCKIIGVDWTTAAWSTLVLHAPIKFYQCTMNDSSFFGLKMEGVVMESCKSHEVDFREGNFSDAKFSHTDFSNSLFGHTNLTGADFTDAINYNIDIHFNEIKRAKFCRYEAVRLLNSLDIELVD